MKKQFFILFLIPFLYGCPVCYEPTKMVDIGPIPDSLYKLVPYQDSTVNKFIHSNGYVVSFMTSRKTYEELAFDECGCHEVKYYHNTTTMISEYPAITINLNFAHLDTISFGLEIAVQNNYFENIDFIQKAFKESKPDSVLVNNKYYKNVFVFKNYDLYNNRAKFADSIFYNSDKGIIKIFMTNGESYSIYN